VKNSLTPVPLAELGRGNNLLQSGFWGAFKRETEKDALSFRLLSSAGECPLLVILRAAPGGGTWAYVPHGPDLAVAEASQGPLLESVAESLAPFLPADCLTVRFDTPWRSPYDAPEYYREDGRWEGPPDPRVREVRMNFGSATRNLRKAQTDVQPPDTVIVRLDRDEAAILRGMRFQTRHAIRRAARKGLVIERGGYRDLGAWYRLYRETAERKGLARLGPAYFRKFFRAHQRYTGRKPHVVLLFAKAGRRRIAAAISAFCGKKATYVYAASSGEGSEFRPAYGLLWEAMKTARAVGCVEYDLAGIPPNDDKDHPLHGLWTFKTGFGGRILHRRGCWDFPLRRDRYRVFAAVEPALGGYHRDA